MVEKESMDLSVAWQCRLLGISRSSVYSPRGSDHKAEDWALMEVIDKQFLETPHDGSRKMTAWLRRQGHGVNRKRVHRLMRLMGLEVSTRSRIPASRMPSTGSVRTCCKA